MTRATNPERKHTTVGCLPEDREAFVTVHDEVKRRLGVKISSIAFFGLMVSSADPKKIIETMLKNAMDD